MLPVYSLRNIFWLLFTASVYTILSLRYLTLICPEYYRVCLVVGRSDPPFSEGAQGGHKSMGGWDGITYKVTLLIRNYRNNQTAHKKVTKQYILQKHTQTHTRIHTMPLAHNLHRSVLTLLRCYRPCGRDVFF